MGHEHSVHDSDARFSIDPVTRMIKNESKKKLSLIQGDHNSEIFSFTCPRYIEFHDMSLCNKVEVHYFNYDAQTNKFNSGIYEADDLQVGEDENSVVFSWKISGNGTQLQGRLEFLVRFKCEKDGIVTYAWNTAFFTEANVGKGSNADSLFEKEYVDIIEQWKKSVVQGFADDLVIEAKKAVDVYAEQWTSGLANANKQIGFLSNYVTPQMFGAKGDGVTDDTAAFKQAIEHLYNSAKGTGWKYTRKLFIPCGEYIISEPLLDDTRYSAVKFIFEGEGYTNTIIRVAAGCNVLFPNHDIYGFTTFSGISFVGANNTQTFMEVLSGVTGNAQSMYFYRCFFSQFHTVLKLGRAKNATHDTMASETLLSECKITNCGTNENPCELFILDNQQSVNNRLFATDIESFTGTLFKYKKGNAITFYQGSIISFGNSVIVDGTEIDGNTSGGGNQPNLTMWGCRFELRGKTKLLNHGTNWGCLVLSFNECGMGCTNLDEGVKTICIRGTGSAYIFFNRCRNAKTMFAEMLNINSNTSRSNIQTKIHFNECDLSAKDFVENSVFTVDGNNTYVAHPEIRIEGIHYSLDNSVKKAPLGNHLKEIKKCILDGVYYSGIECGNPTSPRNYTNNIYSYIKEIELVNIGNGVYEGYTTNYLTCDFYDENDTLIGTIKNIKLSSGKATLAVNKYVKTLKMKFTTDLTGGNPILPISMMATIIG